MAKGVALELKDYGSIVLMGNRNFPWKSVVSASHFLARGEITPSGGGHSPRLAPSFVTLRPRTGDPGSENT
ncbi:hypothetical protein EVAR_69697_1 [Eumeta japonica]|uniref:Uncharacterized protein n=1 Tax=Eumeta variegata TaxID=151549 RepID=A0A4C1SH61_EUMVA|nr:hypothetical protein EVAR_69697_1 [Eumeta japonica]